MFKKQRVRLILIIFLCLITVAGSTTSIVLLVQRHNEQSEQEAYKVFLEKCYEEQNEAFGILKEPFYLPYSRVNEMLLFYGLEMYRLETGEVLTMEEVWNYLSSPYEENGELRIYKNHEKIAKFIEFSTDAMATNYDSGPRGWVKYIETWNKFADISEALYYGEHEDYLRSLKALSYPFELITKMLTKVYNPDYEIELPLTNEQYYQYNIPKDEVQIYKPAE